MPPIHFAPADGADIAYTDTGTGDIPLVWTLGFISHQDTNWGFPPFRRFAEELGEFTRLIVYYKRGMGMSSRSAPGTTLEQRMDDIGAVMDHAGLDRAAMFGESEGGSLATMFAASHPERTTHLILQGANSGVDRDEAATERLEAYLEALPSTWGRPDPDFVASSFGTDVEDPVWVAEFLARLSANAATPRDIVEWERVAQSIDIRSIVPSVAVPTLVLQCADDGNVEQGRWLARNIPGARYVERPGSAHVAWLKPETVIPDIREFLTGARAGATSDRILATLLFTDLVDSTKRAAAMGDEAWRSLLESHHRVVRQALDAGRGIEVGSSGDGFLARFDGPGRAIRCAERIIAESERLGLGVRAGVHTGEIELVGDDVAGLGVHVAARIAGMAAGGDILVSGTVRDISVGSGIEFEDRGECQLKGLPEPWRVFAVGRAPT